MTHPIQWLNRPGTKGESWNPIRGCTRVSEGCKHCYAVIMAKRLACMADAAVTIEPAVLSVAGAPLSKRKRFVTVKNEAVEAVQVTCRVDPIEHLQSVTIDGVLGTQLGCETWTVIEPEAASGLLH